MEQNKKTLAAKILAVKSKIGKIVKDSSVQVDKSGKKVSYASLTVILEKLTPVLSETGIDYVVSPVFSELSVSLLPQNYRFFSIHFVDVETGETSEPICYPFHMANNYEAIKADGSTITYATRYLLGLALGLQTEEDPDAKFEKSEQTKPQQQQTPLPPAAPTKTEKDAFNAKLEKTDFEDASQYMISLQKKYPKHDFVGWIDFAKKLKSGFKEFAELLESGLIEKAEEKLIAMKTENPKAKFDAWDKKLSEVSVSLNAN